MVPVAMKTAEQDGSSACDVRVRGQFVRVVAAVLRHGSVRRQQVAYIGEAATTAVRASGPACVQRGGPVAVVAVRHAARHPDVAGDDVLGGRRRPGVHTAGCAPRCCDGIEAPVVAPREHAHNQDLGARA